MDEAVQEVIGFYVMVIIIFAILGAGVLLGRCAVEANFTLSEMKTDEATGEKSLIYEGVIYRPEKSQEY